MGLTNNLGKLSNMITSTGSAVGIAQTSPSYTLDVTGTGRFTSALTMQGNINVENNFVLNLGSNQGGGATLKYNSNGNLDITPRSGFSTIFTTGNVGIGTNSPVSLLNLSASTPTLTITDSAATGNGGNTYISSIKNGVGYNNLTFTAYSYTFLGGGSASTFLTINTAGAATFSSSVTASGNITSVASTGFIGSYSTNPANDAGIGAYWSGTSGLEIKYNPNSAIGYIQSLYQAASGQPFGDIQFRQNVGGTMTTRMIIKADGGNVGIGTSSPSYTLQVNNSSGASATTTSSGVAEFRAQGGGYSGSYNTSLRSIAGAIGVLQLGNNNDNYILAGNTAANGYLIIRVSCSSESISSGIEAMRITSTGNVGIGTSSPSCKLDTYGTSGTTSLRVRDGNLTATAQILLECANTFSGISQAFISGVGTNGGNNSIDLTFGTSSGSSSAAERMRITSGGNLLIGTTTSPTSGGFTNTTVLIKQIANGGAGGGLQIEADGSDNVAFFGFEAANSAFTIGTSYRATGSYQPIAFRAGGPERMRITSGGNVCIGTTSSVGGGDLSVQGSSSAQISIGAKNVTGANASLYLECAGQFGAGFYADRASGSMRGWVSSSSSGVSLAAGGTSWGSYSDERLKDIIEPIENAVEKINTLRSVIGKYKIDDIDKRRVFLIAQDVQKILPEAVYDDKSENKLLSLQYTDIIPLLVKAIQEQQQQIDELKLKIK